MSWYRKALYERIGEKTKVAVTPNGTKKRKRTGPSNGIDCIYHGEQIGLARCGCGSGQKETPVYSCELHGRCADRQAHADGKGSIVWCNWCEDFTARPVQ